MGLLNLVLSPKKAHPCAKPRFCVFCQNPRRRLGCNREQEQYAVTVSPVTRDDLRIWVEETPDRIGIKSAYK